MFSLPPELLVYSKYLTPPLIGAFIGYLTNAVAIRMLFRPLKAWRVLGVRLPMTPGIIPAKRDELAKNMGEVVGDHLLTGKDIAKGLHNEAFQRHLYNLIHERMEGLLQRDLGNLPSLVPEKYQVYFEVGKKTLSYQIKEQIHNFIASDPFRSKLEEIIGKRFDRFLESDADAVLTAEHREGVYSFLEESVAKLLAGRGIDQWVEEAIREKVTVVLTQGKSLADILPDSLIELLTETIVNQTPALLRKISRLVGEPEVRDKIVKGACGGIENFIGSLGGMADFVRGFLRMDTVEAKIHHYLQDKEEDIAAWLQSEVVQARLVAILRERSRDFLQKPINDWAKNKEDFVTAFCSQCTQQVLSLLKNEEVPAVLASMIRTSAEEYFQPGRMSLGQLGTVFVGDRTMASARKKLMSEVSELLNSPATLEAIDSVVDQLLAQLLKKKVGKLANLIPAGVRQGLAQSLLKMTVNMLEIEVPDLVQSLNIRKIVTEKLDSLDILKLEGLLLSIMEEQFKYINIFGGLLGFLIGCANLLVL